MTPSHQKYKLHEALGYLFYAIAAADKKVAPKEMELFRSIIQTDWLPIEGMVEPLFQVEIVFDRLLEQNVDADAALGTFKLFKEEHSELFTDALKKRIWKTVNSMAEAVAGKNKSELVLLSKLSVIFRG
jgi:hypothetical protein